MQYFIHVKYSMQITIFILFIELLLSVFTGKYYFRGWVNVDFKSILLLFFIFAILVVYYFVKIKDIPEFFRCKKCHKVYNYVDVKDKDKICPKCGGELQDYKEFEKEEQEKKNKEFERIDKIERELIEKYKKSKK